MSMTLFATQNTNLFFEQIGLDGVRLGSGYLIPGIPEPDQNYFAIPEPDRNRPLDRRVPGMSKGVQFYTEYGYF